MNPNGVATYVDLVNNLGVASSQESAQFLAESPDAPSLLHSELGHVG